MIELIIDLTLQQARHRTRTDQIITCRRGGWDHDGWFISIDSGSGTYKCRFWLDWLYKVGMFKYMPVVAARDAGECMFCIWNVLVSSATSTSQKMQFVLMKVKLCLWCTDLQTIFSRCEDTCLFASNPSKNCIISFYSDIEMFRFYLSTEQVTCHNHNYYKSNRNMSFSCCVSLIGDRVCYRTMS